MDGMMSFDEEAEPMEVEEQIEYDTLRSPVSASAQAGRVLDEGKAAVRVGKSAPTWVESSVMEFPEELPTEFTYEEKLFYVRKCYPPYYEMIKERLEVVAAEVVVTVTGAPGIGKSVFFGYFFERYRWENPNVTIITASFRNAEMMNVVVWRGTERIGMAQTTWEMEALIKEAKNQGAKDGVLYLYDGSPRTCPTRTKMVCFTSPSEVWFRQLKKQKSCRKLIMPLWEFEELQSAAEELNLAMTVPVVFGPTLNRAGRRITATDESEDMFMVADQLEQRYIIFGGIARECLSTDAEFVEDRRQLIEDTIKMFEQIDKIRFVLYTVEGEQTRHRICHYVPNPTNPFMKYTLAEPAIFVKRQLVERLGRLVADTRKAIIACLRVCPEAASFRGTLFETGVHELLSSGCNVAATSLGTAIPKTRRFKLKKSTPAKNGERYCLFDRTFSASILSSGPYHVPSAENFVSIDSFYYYPSSIPSFSSTRKLLLFQMTVAQTHPVNGEGLEFVLDQLGLLETVTRQPEQAALIFVVPVENAESFVHQNIELELSNDEDDVSKVRDIGGKRAASLKSVEIRTIGDLRKRLEDAEKENTGDMTQIATGLSLRFLRKVLATHDEKKKRPWLKQTLSAIPQFVWGAKLDPLYAMS